MLHLVLNALKATLPPIFVDVALKVILSQETLLLHEVIRLFVHGVVGEVFEPVLDILQVVVPSAEPDVAFLEEPNLDRIEVQHQTPLPNVQFPPRVKQGVFDILLTDIGVLANLYLIYYRGKPRKQRDPASPRKPRGL